MDPGHHVERGQASYFGSGVRAEARGPEQGGVGEGSQLPPPASHGVWGKTTVVYIAVSMLPQWGPGQSS